MKCVEFLNTAQANFGAANNSPDEFCCRLIVHACYYSVYHYLAGRLGLNPTVKNEAHHSKVEARVLSYTGLDAAIIEAKKHFTSLKDARVDADYRMNAKVNHLVAQRCISRARMIFAAGGVAINLIEFMQAQPINAANTLPTPATPNAPAPRA